MPTNPPKASEVTAGELLPCPICKMKPVRNGRGGVGGVLCTSAAPAHLFQTYGADQAEADAAWNTRTTPDNRIETVGDVPAALNDPNAVHINMLRGSIAKPSVEQIVHIYGRDTLLAALAVQPAQDKGRLLLATMMAEWRSGRDGDDVFGEHGSAAESILSTPTALDEAAIRLDRALAAVERLWDDGQPTLITVKIALGALA